MKITIDGHFDLLYDVLRKRQMGKTHVIEKDFLNDFKKGGVNVLVSSLFIDSQFIPEMALRRALDQINSLYEEIEESGDKIQLCKNVQDMNKALESNKLGIFLSFEGIEPIYNDLGLLRIFYELGVRLMGLTWSRRNYAADGVYFSPVEEGQVGGLTNFGYRVARRAQELGIIMDVSHLNEPGFWDLMKITKDPIIASHSNCKGLVDVSRNLSDEQIRAIAHTDGVIGINAANMFVSKDNNSADYKSYVNHIDYICNLVGHKHVALGFDLCDHIRKYEYKEDKDNKFFDVIKNHSQVYKIEEELKLRGYKEEHINDILGQNWIRVYNKVLK